MQLNSYFADLHVHIGRSSTGQLVKVSSSRDLTFQNIAYEASERKGIHLVGIIDCHSPVVQADIMQALDSGEMQEIPEGGIRYRKSTLLLGMEMEVQDQGGGPYHLLAYFPTLAAMMEWTKWIQGYVTNVQLSTQRMRISGREVQKEVTARGGLFIPAHIFTPHRGLLGCSCFQVAERLEIDQIAAVELGLSADTHLAGQLSQLNAYPFLTNSDAHSLGRIGRECNELLLANLSFTEFAAALKNENGRQIRTNYGLHPMLGKYHGTCCARCQIALNQKQESKGQCPQCGSHRLVRGVADLVHRLADQKKAEVKRPPYRNQVPLSYYPGIGQITKEKMLCELGTEMDILHHLSYDSIAAVVGDKIASAILEVRTNNVSFLAGRGGIYGKLVL